MPLHVCNIYNFIPPVTIQRLLHASEATFAGVVPNILQTLNHHSRHAWLFCYANCHVTKNVISHVVRRGGNGEKHIAGGVIPAES